LRKPSMTTKSLGKHPCVSKKKSLGKVSSVETIYKSN